jgi:prepilin-type N-terminal cleavage/methylation domain-containing protein
MLARIRKSMDEKDQGFTLIELLVVMIIIGILAAIAIPVFLSQRQKAQDTATKADVTTIGKEVATYYVDNTAAPTGGVAINASNQYTVGGTVVGRVSQPSTTTIKSTHFTSATSWCVALQNTAGATPIWKYSAANGLASGADCATPGDY